MAISVNLIDHRQNDTRSHLRFRADDVKLATDTKARQKTAHIWRKSSADVDLYLDDRDIPDQPIDPRANAITIVLRHNEGLERLPLTGWIIAHRMYHALEYGLNRGIEKLPYYCMVCHREYEQLLIMASRAYTHVPYAKKHFNQAFAHAIGMSKAARTNQLTTPSEIIPEAFAQFMLTGTVRFKDAPDHLSLFDSLDTVTVCDRAAFQDLNQHVHLLAVSYQDRFGKMLAEATGHIFTL